MKKNEISAKYVTTHYVDQVYHQLHSHMIHLHDDVVELLYIVKGSGSYIVNGQGYNVSHGSLIICNQSVLHGQPPASQNNSGMLESYCCVLTGLQLPGLPPNTLIDENQNPVLFFDYDKMPVENIITATYELNQDPDKYYDICDSLANALLNIVYMKIKDSTKAEKPAVRIKKDTPVQSRRDFIRSVTNYLDKHFEDSLSLQELGEEFHISHYHLSHLYKQETGLSPMKYVMHRRIGEAQSLLMNSDMQISEISSAVGFEDNCYFSSTFKKYVGLTPTEYRQHFRQ